MPPGIIFGSRGMVTAEMKNESPTVASEHIPYWFSFMYIIIPIYHKNITSKLMINQMRVCLCFDFHFRDLSLEIPLLYLNENP